jgi:hypothetical protein
MQDPDRRGRRARCAALIQGCRVHEWSWNAPSLFSKHQRAVAPRRSRVAYDIFAVQDEITEQVAWVIEPEKMLSRLIRPEKLGIDPTFQAIALHLDPVPLPVCNLEPRAFAGGPNNSPVSRWRRPDVYARTL